MEHRARPFGISDFEIMRCDLCRLSSILRLAVSPYPRVVQVYPVPFPGSSSKLGRPILYFGTVRPEVAGIHDIFLKSTFRAS
jgi:hypothetical protein